MFENIRKRNLYCKLDSLELEGENPSLEFVDKFRFNNNGKHLIGFGAERFVIIVLEGHYKCYGHVHTIEKKKFEKILDLNITEENDIVLC